MKSFFIVKERLINNKQSEAELFAIFLKKIAKQLNIKLENLRIENWTHQVQDEVGNVIPGKLKYTTYFKFSVDEKSNSYEKFVKKLERG